MKLAVAAVLVCLALTGCEDDLVNTNKGYVSGNGDVKLIPVEKRELPGPIAGTSLTGEEIALADFKGKLVVMPVWGAWCGPCRAEAPMFQAASEDLADDGVAFLGLNTRDSNEGYRESFIRTTGMTYPSIEDNSGKQILYFKAGLGPTTMPAVAFFDEEGRVAAIVAGEITRTTLYDVIEEIQS